MLAKPETISDQALEAFRVNLRQYRAQNDNMSQAALGRAVRQKIKKTRPGATEGFAVKNISNIEAGRYIPGIETLTAIAETIGVPLWVMFIPDLPSEFLRDSRIKQLHRLIRNYMDCGEKERQQIEHVADGYAALCRGTKK